jgi:hypothetical protein
MCCGYEEIEKLDVEFLDIAMTQFVLITWICLNFAKFMLLVLLLQRLLILKLLGIFL